MKRNQSSMLSAPGGDRPQRDRWWILAGVAFVSILPYTDTFAVPLLLDDRFAITDNASIRNLWSLDQVFAPPAQATTGGRPLANFTFALSYALSGLAPWGYHLCNLIIHALASLALFGVVRRTFLTPHLKIRFGDSAAFLAGAVAMLWSAHPVQVQTVTYISQRTESLMALFYLLTLYCFIRGAEGRATLWHPLAVVACLLGALCKEGIVTAPLIALLYDRTFFSATFRSALLRRKWVYVGLVSTWVALACLLLDVKSRGVGFDLGVTSSHYALTQCHAIVLYLRLSLWPFPLIFDRNPEVTGSIGAALPYALVLVGLIAASVWTWIKHPRWALLPIWFFVLLSPTSSIVPITGAPIAENRVYLPLAAVITLVVVGTQCALGRRASRAFFGLLLVASVVATFSRNRDFRSGIAIWTDTVRKAPTNHRAHENLATFLAATPGRQPDALLHYAEALRLRPHSSTTHHNLALLLVTLPGRQHDALEHYATALRLRPDSYSTHYNLALLLATLPHRQQEAVAHYEESLRLNPNFAQAHYDLANLLTTIPGRTQAALAHYERSLQIDPKRAQTHSNLATLLASLPDRRHEAQAHYEKALELGPIHPEVHNNFANLLSTLPGRQNAALAHYRECLRLKPDYAAAHNNLALLLASMPDRQDEALEHFESALRLLPNNAMIHLNMARQLEKFAGREAAARHHYTQALALMPTLSAARDAIERLDKSLP